MSRSSLAFALWIAVAAIAPMGCGARPVHERPDLVLVVIDTLRADHVGAYGYGRPTSPNLDALAAEGQLFTDATSTSSWTRPAIASLFTGRLPSEHGVVASRDVLPASLSTLAERLKAVGYQTVGISGNFVNVNKDNGMAAGFDRFEIVNIHLGEDGGDMLVKVWGTRIRAPNASEVNAQVFETLDDMDAATDAPVFLYVHYMDPHAGYIPPEAFRRRFSDAPAGPAVTSKHVVDLAGGRVSLAKGERERLIDLYDAEVAFADEGVGELLAGLESRGLRRDAVVTVLADHGEEFLDHGSWFHGFTLYREMLHVPLIIRDFREHAAGVRRAEPVDLIDVFATLLGLAGAPSDVASTGRDLLAPGRLPPRPRIAELEPDALREAHVHPIRHRRSVDLGPWKIVVDAEGHSVAYQEGEDPNELSPLPVDSPGIPDALRDRAQQLAREAATGRPQRAPELTPEEREGLRALGYAE